VTAEAKMVYFMLPGVERNIMSHGIEARTPTWEEWQEDYPNDSLMSMPERRYSGTGAYRTARCLVRHPFFEPRILFVVRMSIKQTGFYGYWSEVDSSGTYLDMSGEHKLYGLAGNIIWSDLLWAMPEDMTSV